MGYSGGIIDNKESSMRRKHRLCGAALAGLLGLARCGGIGGELPCRIIVDPSLAGIVTVSHQLAAAGTEVLVAVRAGDSFLDSFSIGYDRGGGPVELPFSYPYGFFFVMPRGDIRIVPLPIRTTALTSPLGGDGGAFSSINMQAADGYSRRYEITVTADETLDPVVFYSLRNVHVALSGDGTTRTLSLSGAGSLFTLQGRVTLTLGAGVVLEGIPANDDSPLIRVGAGWEGSRLVLNGGSVTDNTTTGSGGGVYVDTGGAFAMEDGAVAGNTAVGSGGGVYVNYGGSFTMKGGSVAGNTAARGGGVAAAGGSAVFVKTGGVIYDDTGGADANTATGGPSQGHAAYIEANGSYRDTAAAAGDALNSGDGTGFLP
jgi:hypothetical protein